MPISCFGVVLSDELGRLPRGDGLRHSGTLKSLLLFRNEWHLHFCMCTTAASWSFLLHWDFDQADTFRPADSTGSWTRYGLTSHLPPLTLCRDGWCGPGMMAMGRYFTVLVTCWIGGKPTLGDTQHLEVRMETSALKTSRKWEGPPFLAGTFTYISGLASVHLVDFSVWSSWEADPLDPQAQFLIFVSTSFCHKCSVSPLWCSPLGDGAALPLVTRVESRDLRTLKSSVTQCPVSSSCSLLKQESLLTPDLIIRAAVSDLSMTNEVSGWNEILWSDCFWGLWVMRLWRWHFSGWSCCWRSIHAASLELSLCLDAGDGGGWGCVNFVQWFYIVKRGRGGQQRRGS